MSQSSIEFREVFEEHLFEEIELESIVKLQFNEETLKKNFEVLIKILRDLKIGVGKSNKRSSQNEKEIVDLKQTSDVLQKEVEQLKGQNDDLLEEIRKIKEKQDEQQRDIDFLTNENEVRKEQIAQQQNKLNEQEGQIETLQKSDAKNKDDIAYLMDQLQKLKQMIAGLSGNDSGIDKDAFDKLVSDVKQIKESYVTQEQFQNQCDIYDKDIQWIKDELERLKRAINNLGDINALRDELADLLKRLQDLENMMRDKVDVDYFEQQINYLKQLIASLGSGKDMPAPIMPAGLSAKEAALLKELDKRVGDLEEALKQLKKEVKDHKDDYKQFSTDTNNRLKNLEDLLDKLLNQVKALQKLKDNVDRLTQAHQETSDLTHQNDKAIQELRRLLELLGNNKPVAVSGGGGVSEEWVNKRLNQLRDELLKLIQGLRNDLNDKASMKDLYKSEALILKKLDEVAEAILSKCAADKQDTKKALIYLEKKINQLFLLIQELKGNNNNGKDKPTDSDALLARRPLVWSCVSCDKGLDDYNGKLGDHKYWGVFPPKETTPERLGQFGKQFRVMQEKQMLREKQFEKQKLSTSQTKFQQRFNHLPGQPGEPLGESELPNIHAKQYV